MKKITKYHYASIFIIILMLLYYLIPTTNIDNSSYLLHDARWWYNQYIEFKYSFPSIMPISFSSFNNSGLAMTIFYPNNVIRLIEIPLVLCNVSNPYIVIGYLSIINITITFIMIHLVVNYMKIKNPIFISLFFTSFFVLPQNAGPVNSISQQLAISFIFYGMYGIISKKYTHLAISTVLLLNTSISTSIIAVITFFIIQIITSFTYTEWKRFIMAGIIGVIASLNVIIPIAKNIHNVAMPTQKFNSDQTKTTILDYYNNNLIDPYFLIRIALFIVPLLLISLYLYASYKQEKSLKIKIIAAVAGIMTILSLFPKLNGSIMTPIQPGTWTRTWPIFIILIIFLFSTIHLEKHFLICASIAVSTLLISISFLNSNPITEINNEYNTAYKNKNWQNVASNLQISIYDIPSNKKDYNHIKNMVADLSPDYIPAKATLNDNRIVYTTPQEWLSKYGLEKHSINNGKTLKITIDPKHNVTPLGVWHYDFLKYNVSSTNGKVVVSTHDMFEYHGTKKTTILISEKQ